MALIVVLSPASLAARNSGVFTGATSSPYYTEVVTGCGSVKLATPKWSSTTGIGTLGVSTKGVSCSGLYGLTSDNYGSGEAGLTVVIPVTLTSSNTGANLTIRLAGTWSVGSKGTVGPDCATTSSSSSDYYYWWIPSWYNYTYSYGYCTLDASVGLSGYAYLIDVTTGTYYYSSTSWTGMTQSDDQYVSSDDYTYTYSNPAYWVDNGSGWSDNGGSSGAAGSGTFSGLSPDWFFNGSFTTGDHYVIESDIYATALASVSGVKKGDSASAAVSFSSGSNGMKWAVVTY